MKSQGEISIRSIVKVLAVLAGVWVLYKIRDVLAIFLVAIIIAAAMDPIVSWMQKKKFPRAAGILSVYLVLLLVLIVGLSFLIPPLTSQLKDLSQNFPKYFQEVQDFFGPIKSFFESQNIPVNTQNLVGNFSSAVSNFTVNIFSTTYSLFSALVSVIAVFSLAFYLSLDEKGMEDFLITITPKRYENYASRFVYRFKNKIGKWLQGQILLMVVVFLLDFIGLYAIGLKYALVLGIFAGLLEIIPYVGPIISAIPGVVLGFLISPMTGFLALIVYIAVQQIENHILSPLIMKKAVGLNPVIIILVLLSGAKLEGVLGAILAIPVASAVGMFVVDLLNWNEG